MTCFSTPSDCSFCSASCVYVGLSIEYGTPRSLADKLLAPEDYPKTQRTLATLALPQLLLLLH